MRLVAYKLLGAVVLMPLAVLGLRFTKFEGFFLLFLVGFILSILYWMDLGRVLREVERPTPRQRVLGILFGIPQAVFGLTCVVCGCAIIIWVLYNNLFARSPAYSGGFLTFGMGPVLVLFGAGWVVYAFKRESNVSDERARDASTEN